MSPQTLPNSTRRLSLLAQLTVATSRYELPHGWLTESGLLEPLLPYLSEPGHDHPTHHRKRDAHGEVIYEPCRHVEGCLEVDPPWICGHWMDEEWVEPHHLHDVGPELATLLLETMPPAALSRDTSSWAPAAASVLRAIVENPGLVVAHGSVTTTPDYHQGIELNLVVINEPTLWPLAPDVVAGPLPAWIDELSPQDYREYLAERQDCLNHGTTRPAWFAAMNRFGLTDTRRFPIIDRFAGGLAAAW